MPGGCFPDLSSLQTFFPSKLDAATAPVVEVAETSFSVTAGVIQTNRDSSHRGYRSNSSAALTNPLLAEEFCVNAKSFPSNQFPAKRHHNLFLSSVEEEDTYPAYCPHGNSLMKFHHLPR